jgi:sirohydrochlorin cobaltochelatase
MSKIGVMVCGHGSRDVEAITEFGAVAAGIAQRLPEYPVESGFLEFARPIIRDGLEKLRHKGVEHILAVPGMLFAAGHVKNDVPSVLNEYRAEFPRLKIEYGRDLAIDTRLLRAAGERIEQAERVSSRRVPREETMLMVVGRGTSDPDANSNITKVARMLWEGMGFGWAEVCYSGVTFPLVGPGLEHAVKLGYRRIIVFPYFLFTGVLVKRIYNITDEMAAQHPEGAVSQRSPAGARRLRRPGAGDPRRREQHELPDVQIPGAGHRLRGRSGPAPGRPSPSCPGHRH